MRCRGIAGQEVQKMQHDTAATSILFIYCSCYMTDSHTPYGKYEHSGTNGQPTRDPQLFNKISTMTLKVKFKWV